MAVVVLDTHVLVAALLCGGVACRSVLRACLTGHLRPVIGSALFHEYEDVFSRRHLFAQASLPADKRREVLDAYLARCRWVEVFYAWRPNLPDESDNHLVELGVAAQASAIITRNLRDLGRGELRFPTLQVLTPEQCLEVFNVNTHRSTD